jgi:hypothetical protein
MAYVGASTDHSNFCVPVASIIPQKNEPIWMKGACAFTTIATGEFLMELSVVGTALIATPATNYIGIRKNTGDSTFYVVSRYASGTEQKTALTMDTLADGTWYDFCVKITRPYSTAEMGAVDVWWGTNLYPGQGYSNSQHVDIVGATPQFPDTVATAPAIDIRPYASGVTAYLDYFVWQIGD